MAKTQWSDLTPFEQRLVIVGAAVELVMTTLALIDLARRPDSEVRGPRWAWALASVVQPVGPIAYALGGRR